MSRLSVWCEVPWNRLIDIISLLFLRCPTEVQEEIVDSTVSLFQCSFTSPELTHKLVDWNTDTSDLQVWFVVLLLLFCVVFFKGEEGLQLTAIIYVMQFAESLTYQIRVKYAKITHYLYPTFKYFTVADAGRIDPSFWPLKYYTCHYRCYREGVTRHYNLMAVIWQENGAPSKLPLGHHFNKEIWSSAGRMQLRCCQMRPSSWLLIRLQNHWMKMRVWLTLAKRQTA